MVWGKGCLCWPTLRHPFRTEFIQGTGRGEKAGREGGETSYDHRVEARKTGRIMGQEG